MVSPRKSTAAQDRILIVEPDPAISDLIGRQALQSVGYQVQVVTDAASAIARAVQWAPDLILLDMNLAGLSGKDLIVALASQGIQTPVIVIAPRGAESDIIQTFRLGATDYLLLPVREAEVVNAVNRALQQVRDRRERERLAQQLQHANQELQSRVRELTTIFALGKAMTSVTNQARLLEDILDAALRTTQADVGWLLLREDTNRPFLLAVERGLPPGIGARLNQPWDDGISALVAMSGEALEIHGEALRRFKIASLGQAALILPIKGQKIVFGLLAVMRSARPFGMGEQSLLTALADYAAISLVNARLFRAMEERAQTYQQGAALSQLAGKVNNDILRAARQELSGPSAAALEALQAALKPRDPAAQREALETARAAMQRVNAVASAIQPVRLPRALPERVQIDVVDLVNQSLRRLHPYARRLGVSFTTALPDAALTVCGDSGLLGQVFDSLLTNAIKYTRADAPVGARLTGKEGQAVLVVHTPGAHIAAEQAEPIFDEKQPASTGIPARFGGLGIRLGLAREIVQRHRGRLWFEDRPGEGVNFLISLPLANC